MTKKDKASLATPIKTPEDLLADDRMAKYMRKQKLLVKVVKTKLWKLLFWKKLFMHEDILKQQDELFNNLFGDKLDKVDSRYVDAIFLSYSKRQNKDKKSDELCMKKLYTTSWKRLEKNNFDISTMQVDISDSTSKEKDKVFLSLTEYINLLENIRVEFKAINAEYETKAKNELKNIDDEEVFTDYQAHSPADDIRNKKIELCSKSYDTLIKSANIDVDFTDLCTLFYLAFKWIKNLDPAKKIFEHAMKSEISVDDIFLKDDKNSDIQQKTITLDRLMMIFEKLLKENTNHMHLRNMYDIS